MTKKYQVLSPDGFTIDYHKEFYSSRKEMMKAFNEWKKRYQPQGYYSSTNYGRIDLSDLVDFCQFIQL